MLQMESVDGVVVAGDGGVECVVVALVALASAAAGKGQIVGVAGGTVVEGVVAGAQHAQSHGVGVANLTDGQCIAVAGDFGIHSLCAHGIAGASLCYGNGAVVARLVQIDLVVSSKSRQGK